MTQISKVQIAALEKARLHPAHYNANLKGVDDAGLGGVVLDPHQGYLDQAHLDVDPEDAIPKDANLGPANFDANLRMQISRMPISIRPITMQISRV